MKRSGLMGGAAAAVLGLAIPTTAAAAPTVGDDHVMIVDPSGQATVAASGTAMVVDGDHARWALGAVLGALLGTAMAAFGANRLLNLFAGAKRPTSPSPKKAAKRRLSPRTAELVARTSATAKQSGDLALRGTVIVAGGLIALALLDLSWKASLAVGAASVLGGLFLGKDKSSPSTVLEAS